MHMSNMQALSLQLWIIQLIFVCFFVAGFVTLYHFIWAQAFRNPQTSARKSWAYRILLMVLAIGIGFMLHLGGYIATSNAMLYHNVALFLVTFPLMDEKISLPEYLTRCLALLIVWVMHHADNLTQPAFYLTFVAALVMMVYIWRRRIPLHENYYALSAVLMYWAVTFWFSLPAMSAGVHTNLLIEVEAVVMYALMTIFFVWYTRAQELTAEHNARLAKLANYDSLTNAKTYSLYQRDVTAAFNQARATHSPFTLVCLDIDNFKQVNDHYGHMAGNAVLIGVAQTLNHVLAKYDKTIQIYRTGGEEFNIVFPGKTPNAALPVVKDCWNAVRHNHFSYEDYDIAVTLSVGMTAARDTDAGIDDTYKRADDNLYMSKHNGRDVITIEGETLNAGRPQRFVATYTFFTQDVVDIAKANHPVVRDELLLRMYDYEHERWVLPEVFNISVATQIELVRKALTNSTSHSLAINLTMQQFADDEVARTITDFKASLPDLDALTVEIVDVPDRTVMRRISAIYRAGGVGISLDDVGSDNSYELVRGLLPYANGVKFAMQNMRRDNDMEQMRERLGFWVDVARKNKLEFILEGVENKSEVEMARNDYGISLVQGYYFSKPALPSRI